MLTERAYYGGSQVLTPSGAFAIVPQVGRFVHVTPAGAGLIGNMVDARRFAHTGGPVCYVFNAGADSFTIKDNAGTNTIVTVASNKVAIVSLLDNSTAAGTWVGYVKTRLT